MNQRLYALILSLIIACHSVLLSFPAQASPPAQDPAQQVVKDCVKGGLVAVTAWASVLFLFTPLGPFSAALLARLSYLDNLGYP